MFCTNCGAQLGNDAKFCTSCGTKVGQVQETPVQSTPVQSTPAQSTPAQSTPVQETPVQSTPVQETPVQSVPLQETPVQENPVLNQQMPGQTVTPVQLSKKEQKKLAKAYKKQNKVKKKKKKKPLITVAIIVAVLALGGIGFVFADGPARIKMSSAINLADKYLNDLDYKQAILEYKSAIELAPERPEGYLGMADAYAQLNDYESALAVVNDGLNAVPERLCGDLEEARDTYQAEVDKLFKVQVKGQVTIADQDMNFSNNDPLIDGTVTLKREFEYSGIKRKEHTDDMGYYVFDKVTPGTYTLTVKKNGFADVIQTVVIDDSQEVFFNSMIEIVDDDWIGEGTASGIVYDVVTGEGIGNLTLKLHKGWNNLGGDVVATYYTDAGGMYYTDSINFGNYTVEILDERGLDKTETYLGNSMNIKVLGGTNIGNQDGNVSKPMEEGQVRVVLSWGSYPEDLDTHVWFDNSNDTPWHIAYYAKSFPDIDGSSLTELDLDDTDSFGPETTTIYTPQDGIYHYGVFDYTHESPTDLEYSGAVVNVYSESAGFPTYTFYVPAGEGYYWSVFDYDSRTNTIIPTNRIENDYLDTYTYGDYAEYSIDEYAYDDFRAMFNHEYIDGYYVYDGEDFAYEY